jgi:hypothetical protein
LPKKIPKTKLAMLPATPTVIITQKVFDFMMIEVQHNDFSSTYSYAINNPNNQLVRKGNFKGQMVQLRLSNVPEGSYQFCFYYNDALVTTIPFEKQSAAFDRFKLLHK